MPCAVTATMDDFDALFARAENSLQVEPQHQYGGASGSGRHGRRASWSPLPTTDHQAAPPVLLVEPAKSPKSHRKNSSHHLLGIENNKHSRRRASFNDVSNCANDIGSNVSHLVPRISIAGSASSNSSRETLADDVTSGGLLLQVPDAWSTPSSPGNRRGSIKKRSQRPKSLKLKREVERERVRERTASRRGSCATPEVAAAHLEQLKSWQREYDIMPVRQFQSSSKGKIINRGDTVRRKSFDVTADLALANGDVEHDDDDGTPKSARSSRASSRASIISSNASSTIPGLPPVIHKVLVMGDHGVGKTALVHQFLTSEYMGGTDNLPETEEREESTVSVQLDEQETAFDIIEISTDESFRDQANVDAYIIVYDLTDVDTYKSATLLAQEVKEHNQGQQTALILVANKSDVVRNRAVNKNDALVFASKLNGKYIEVSAVLNHNIDELLVGIAKQIRLNPERWEKHSVKKQATSGGRAVLGKLFKKLAINKTCDNLMVL